MTTLPGFPFSGDICMKKILAAALLGLVAWGAQAQAWPAGKPVTLVVPFPPGGSSDVIARHLVSKLPQKLGGNFIVENKAGAGGTRGTGYGRRGAPASH